MRKINGRQINESQEEAGYTWGQINNALINQACDRFFETRGLPRYDFAGYRGGTRAVASNLAPRKSR